MQAARLSACFSALARKSSASMSPFSAERTGTTFMPAICAEAGLVPWAEVGTLAIVMTAIILAGGIDLSVGSIAALSGVVLGTLYQEAGWPIGLSVFGAIVAGTGAGALNGTLVVAGLSPLVATLATMAFFRGLAMLISDTQRVTGFPESFCELSRLGGVSTQFWLLGVVAVSGLVVVHATIFGRWCFAVGDNRTAARFAAVPVRRVDFALYTVSGLVASLVAIAACMQHDTAVPASMRAGKQRATRVPVYKRSVSRAACSLQRTTGVTWQCRGKECARCLYWACAPCPFCPFFFVRFCPTTRHHHRRAIWSRRRAAVGARGTATSHPHTTHTPHAHTHTHTHAQSFDLPSPSRLCTLPPGGQAEVLL